MMKRILSLVLSLVLLISVFLLSACGEKKSSFAWDKVVPGGKIEKLFLKEGPMAVETVEKEANESFRKYVISYPKPEEGSKETFPAIIISNDSGMTAEDYLPFMKHLSSWGFIVIGTQEEYAWNGFSAIMSVRFLIRCHENETIEGWETNPLYGKVDKDHIGLWGSGAGGTGCVNALLDPETKGLVRCLFVLNPTYPSVSGDPEWSVNASGLSVPVCLFGNQESKNLTNEETQDSVKSYLNLIPETVLGVAGYRLCEEKDLDQECVGLATAWFLYFLKGDKDAGDLYKGLGAEISTSTRMTGVSKNF